MNFATCPGVRPLLVAVAAAVLAAGASAETIKVAFIDPFSGPAGILSKVGINEFRVAEMAYRSQPGADGNTLEFVEFDNKANPQETTLQFKAAVDQGYRYVTQGIGSGASAALLDAVNKHNERNPGKEVVFINWAGNDPDLTNSKCSFWQFRMDSNSDMKLEALTTFMARNAAIKKVYLINQNYATGQAVSKQAKEYLARKRTDMQIVGDDLVPLGQVKDFAPYAAKIKATGADTILTSNYGTDLSLLIKAARESDLKVDFYTLNANAFGAPSAIGANGADRVKLIAYYHQNIEGFPGKDLVETLKKQHDQDFMALGTITAVTMLHQGFKDAKSTDPVKVAFAMEGSKFKTLTGEVEMRKSDHQMQQPLYIASWTKTDGKTVRYDQEGTGYGWKTEEKLDTHVSAQPTSCQMKRPSR
ncbi:MAG: branched-chain amino acid ABC transporter substrate-binding protein [Variovorax sp.]|nr:branched-chain amino acid ABC transporter substrate-binding protein [Variovorax sp.]